MAEIHHPLLKNHPWRQDAFPKIPENMGNPCSINGKKLAEQ